jgi:hypothetical protein
MFIKRFIGLKNAKEQRYFFLETANHVELTLSPEDGNAKGMITSSN